MKLHSSEHAKADEYKFLKSLSQNVNERLHAYNNQTNAWRSDLCGGCAVGARIIQLVGTKLGDKVDLVYGYYENPRYGHVWTRYNDWLVDPTFEQYGTNPVRVTAHKHKSRYRKWSRNSSARKALAQWPDEEALFGHAVFIRKTAALVLKDLEGIRS